MFIPAVISVEVNLEPGIYLLPEYSGSGKTFLYKLLMLLRDSGEKVSGFTYRDFVNKSKVEDIVPQDTKVCVFDRYDMYRGEYISYITGLSKSCVVLVDLKNVFDFKVPDLGIATIIMYKDKIVVR